MTDKVTKPVPEGLVIASGQVIPNPLTGSRVKTGTNPPKHVTFRAT